MLAAKDDVQSTINEVDDDFTSPMQTNTALKLNEASEDTSQSGQNKPHQSNVHNSNKFGFGGVP